MSSTKKNVQENMSMYEKLLYWAVGKSSLNNYQIWSSIEMVIFMTGMIAIGVWGIINDWHENHQILLFGLIALYLFIGTPIMMGVLVPKKYDKGNLHITLYTLISIPGLVKLRQYLNLKQGFLKTLDEYLQEWKYPGPLSANTFKLADKKLAELARNCNTQPFFDLYRLLICFGYKRSLFTKRDHYTLFAEIEEKLGELMEDKRDWDNRCSMFDNMLWEAQTAFTHKVIAPLRNEFLLGFSSEMGKRSLWLNCEDTKAFPEYIRRISDEFSIFSHYNQVTFKHLKSEICPSYEYRTMLLVTTKNDVVMKFSDYCQQNQT